MRSFLQKRLAQEVRALPCMRLLMLADPAGDTITRWSRAGFLVYLNMAPICWISKKQVSIETSSIGSEFTAMKQCTEYIRG